MFLVRLFFKPVLLLFALSLYLHVFYTPVVDGRPTYSSTGQRTSLPQQEPRPVAMDSGQRTVPPQQQPRLVAMDSGQRTVPPQQQPRPSAMDSGQRTVPPQQQPRPSAMDSSQRTVPPQQQPRPVTMDSGQRTVPPQQQPRRAGMNSGQRTVPPQQQPRPVAMDSGQRTVPPQQQPRRAGMNSGQRTVPPQQQPRPAAMDSGQRTVPPQQQPRPAAMDSGQRTVPPQQQPRPAAMDSGQRTVPPQQQPIPVAMDFDQRTIPQQLQSRPVAMDFGQRSVPLQQQSKPVVNNPSQRNVSLQQQPKPVVKNPSQRPVPPQQQPKPVAMSLGQRTALSQQQPKPVNIGFIFDQFTAETQRVFAKVVQYKSHMLSKMNFDLNLLADVIKTADVFKLSRLICHQLSRGVITMLGVIPPDSFRTFHAYAKSFFIPFVAPSTPLLPQDTADNEVSIAMKPDYHEAIIDVIEYLGWHQIIYIFDSDEGLFRMQEIHQNRIRKRQKFVIDHTHRASNASDIVNFLVTIERTNRFSKKYVVLDCGTKMATETIVGHVNNMALGRRNYHYLLSGLVMDDIENVTIKELGAINITGFGVLDKTKKNVQDILKLVDRNTMSAEAALTCDSIEVVIDSIMRITLDEPEFSNASTIRNITKDTKIMDCNNIVPFELGKELASYMKKTELQGTTGFIGFTADGRRKNFTLQVMQMNRHGKVEKMGTWQEGKGLRLSDGTNARREQFGEYNRAKTYVISTIVEHPFIFKEKIEGQPEAFNLLGLCSDLAELVMNKLELNYELILVKDGNYGKRNEKSISGWDGMVGELLRHEVDMVVAPLTMTPGRLEVIDFSQPYLSFWEVNNTLWDTDLLDIMFSIVRPFSKELWFSLGVSIVVVSASLYTLNWLKEGRNGSECRKNGRLHKYVWFTVGALLQQGPGAPPKNAAETILMASWIIFGIFFLASYTAGLSMILTMNRYGVRRHFYTKLSKCPLDYYRSRLEDRESENPLMKFISGLFKTDEIDCELLVSSTKPGIKAFGIALRKGSELREPVNQVLNQLKQEGETERLIRKWFFNTSFLRETKIKAEPITLMEMSGLFLLLIVSIILAFIVAIFQYLRKRRNSNIPIAAESAMENQVALEGAETTPASQEARTFEEAEDFESIEEYGVPQNRNERPYYPRQDVSSLTSHQELAGSLNRAASEPGPSTSRQCRRLSNSYEFQIS